MGEYLVDEEWGKGKGGFLFSDDGKGCSPRTVGEVGPSSPHIPSLHKSSAAQLCPARISIVWLQPLLQKRPQRTHVVLSAASPQSFSVLCLPIKSLVGH